MSKKAKKVTAFIPEDILAAAQHQSGVGITETLIQGLKILAAKNAYTKLKNLRGTIDLKIDMKQVKKDRR